MYGNVSKLKFIPESTQREAWVVLQLLFDDVSKLNTDVCPILDLDKAVKVVFFKVFIDSIAIDEEFKVFNKLYWLPFDSTTFSGYIYSNSAMNITINYPEYNKINEISIVNTSLIYKHLEPDLNYEIIVLKTQFELSQLTPPKENRTLVYSNMNDINMNDLLINIIQM